MTLCSTAPGPWDSVVVVRQNDVCESGQTRILTLLKMVITVHRRLQGSSGRTRIYYLWSERTQIGNDVSSASNRVRLDGRSFFLSGFSRKSSFCFEKFIRLILLRKCGVCVCVFFLCCVCVRVLGGNNLRKVPNFRCVMIRTVVGVHDASCKHFAVSATSNTATRREPDGIRCLIPHVRNYF